MPSGIEENGDDDVSIAILDEIIELVNSIRFIHIYRSFHFDYLYVVYSGNCSRILEKVISAIIRMADRLDRINLLMSHAQELEQISYNLITEILIRRSYQNLRIKENPEIGSGSQFFVTGRVWIFRILWINFHTNIYHFSIFSAFHTTKLKSDYCKTMLPTKMHKYLIYTYILTPVENN